MTVYLGCRITIPRVEQALTWCLHVTSSSFQQSQATGGQLLLEVWQELPLDYLSSAMMPYLLYLKPLADATGILKLLAGVTGMSGIAQFLADVR